MHQTYNNSFCQLLETVMNKIPGMSESIQEHINSMGAKRPLVNLLTEELSNRLRSKEDYYVYLDKHCKYCRIQA